MRQPLQPVKHHRKPERGEEEARPVERLRLGIAVAGHEAGDKQQPGQAERHVDEEVPVPGQIGGDEAAEHRPDHRREQRRPGDQRGGGDQLGLSCAAQNQDAADRRHQRAAQALHDAGGDKFRQTLRETAGDRGQREERNRDQEDGARAEPVGKPGRQRHEHRHGQHIGGDADAHRHRRHVEGFSHLRQRRRDNRRIEQLHEEGDGNNQRHASCLSGWKCRLKHGFVVGDALITRGLNSIKLAQSRVYPTNFRVAVWPVMDGPGMAEETA
jgi:hypothetical protein